MKDKLDPIFGKIVLLKDKLGSLKFEILQVSTTKDKYEPPPKKPERQIQNHRKTNLEA